MNILAMLAADEGVDPALRKVLAADPCQRRAPEQAGVHATPIRALRFCPCADGTCSNLTDGRFNSRGERCRINCDAPQLSED